MEAAATVELELRSLLGESLEPGGSETLGVEENDGLMAPIELEDEEHQPARPFFNQGSHPPAASRSFTPPVRQERRRPGEEEKQTGSGDERRVAAAGARGGG